jgi:hypothetical protein
MIEQARHAVPMLDEAGWYLFGYLDVPGAVSDA